MQKICLLITIPLLFSFKNFDVPLICYDNEVELLKMTTASIDSNFPLDKIADRPAEEIAKFVHDEYQDAVFKGEQLAWYLMMHPQLETKRAAYQLQILYARDFLHDENIDPNIDIKKYLFEAYNTDITYSDEHIKETQGIFKYLRNKNDYNDIQYGIKKAALACVPYASAGCYKAVVRAATFSQPHEYGNAAVSILDLTEDFFINEDYYRGISLAAYRIIKKIESVETGAKLEGDIFTDIYQSFVSAGLSSENASRLTWNFLGVYGTRGPSVLDFSSIATNENAPIMLAYYVISSGISYLDAFALKTFQKRLYSHPEIIKTSCTFTRSYHFWFAAYIAHRLRFEDGFNKRPSMLAPHLMGMGYEFLAGTWGKRRYFPYESSQFSAYNNAVRLSLISNDVGAWFGSNYDKYEDITRHKKYDLDKRIKMIFKNSKKLNYKDKNKFMDKIRTNEMFRYRMWRKLMAPDTGFFHLF